MIINNFIESINVEFSINYGKILKSTHDVKELITATLKGFSEEELKKYSETALAKKNLYFRIRDKVLLQLASDGDDTAIKILMDLYMSYLIKTVRKEFAKTRTFFNNDMVLEKAQDYFTLLWLKREVYDPTRGTIATWIGQMIVYDTISEFRSQTKFQYLIRLRKEDEDDYMDEIVGDGEKDISSPDVLFFKQLAEEEILTKLLDYEGIYPWKKMVYLLRILGYKPAEIVERFLDIQLSELYQVLLLEFMKASSLDSRFISERFESLEKSLDKSINVTILRNDPFTRNVVDCDMDLPIKRAHLRTFLGNNPPHALSDWYRNSTLKLKKRIDDDEDEND